MAKLKQLNGTRAPKPALGRQIRERLERELTAALKRRPSHELELSGVLRAALAHNARLRSSARAALDVLSRRQSFDRPLYHAVLRSLTECSDGGCKDFVVEALKHVHGAGYTAFGAAALCGGSPEVVTTLERIAVAERAHLAFAAELALSYCGRLREGHLVHLAPMVKEVHRVAMCNELLPMFSRRAIVPSGCATALRVLRASERHLGRWLMLGELEVRAGSDAVIDEARSRLASASASGRGSWQLILWSLERARGAAIDVPRAPIDALTRLVERSDRESQFVFRLARARVPACETALASLVSRPISTHAGAYAAMFLARDFARPACRDALINAASSESPISGLATAALFDAGVKDIALKRATAMADSRSLRTAMWAACVRYADRNSQSGAESTMAVDETRYRWIQCGWLE